VLAHEVLPVSKRRIARFQGFRAINQGVHVDDKITANVNPKKQYMAIALAPLARNPLALQEKSTSLSKPRYALANARSAG
jgi:hypothetical protein